MTPRAPPTTGVITASHFQDAIKAFGDRFAVERFDDREDYGEERINPLNVILHVTSTERGARIRIISARRAERHEQDDYYRENAR
jgi:uncharacterized protein